MRILVTGGAGYIGGVVVRDLLAANHDVVALDNLSHGNRAAVATDAEFVEGSIGNSHILDAVFGRYAIDAVIHLAALADVAESVMDPAKYYRNNFGHSLTLLRVMRRHGVKRIVFSSTASVYGNSPHIPIDENQPLEPINAYGRSKMMVEMALEDYRTAYGLEYTILRYFNVAGATSDGCLGETHSSETRLIPKILAVALQQQAALPVNGTDYATPDGTCIRDYIHVEDVARAHILAIENRQKQHIPGRGALYNLGNGSGFSVRQVIEICRKVTGHAIPVKEHARRSGDPAILVASSEKIHRELGWSARYSDLETIVRHALAWHSNRPNGLNS